MTEKKRMYESNVVALPPLRMILGDVPSPDPKQRRKSLPGTEQVNEMESNIRKLIAHLVEPSKQQA